MQFTKIVSSAMVFILLGVVSCSRVPEAPVSEPAAEPASFSINYEKFTLENGLEVIFHRDLSDPVVAVSLTVHVGSAREKPQRTGFAHLFEHLLFLESENLGKGGLDKMSARIGGSGANGSTSRDWTNYFQTVPKDALEKMIWAEADKLGWFINTVTEPVLAKEKQVVKNEKRQRVDNQPYGHNSYVIDKLLYSQDHPYNWQVIGSLEDLQAATLSDVKEFFRQWYVPNNTTLSIAGDFDFEQAKAWVKKYFDEIPRGNDIPKLEKRPGKLDAIKRVYHEDNFATLPQLTMVWPTVEAFHPDEYPLAVLHSYLSEGKQAPLYEELVKQQALAPDVSMFQRSSELAGQMYLWVRAYEGKSLQEVAGAIQTALTRFEQEGISQADLDRIKAGQETAFYQSLSSVVGKSINLARYNILAGNPGYAGKAIDSILSVTAEDVMRVYNTYIKDKHYVATSFVPKGQAELALPDSEQASVVEEQIIAGAEESFDASQQAEYEKTPSTFDRSIEPPYGDAYQLTPPDVWQQQLANDMTVYGISNNEVPLVEASLVIAGGELLDPADKPGVANLMAGMLMLGTAQKSAAEFEAAVEQLGASINVTTESGNTVIQVSSLAKNYAETMALLEEMLLQPGWDETEFGLLKQRTINRLKQQSANPNSIAFNQFRRLLYPDDQRGNNPLGSIQSVEAITIEDIKAYYATNYSPNVATLLVVGDISEQASVAATRGLVEKWKPTDVTLPALELPAAPSSSKLYFYDVPGAKQSVLNIGYPALKATDQDYYPANVMNYILGGGGFASRFTQQLRESKGYTYSVRSRFNATQQFGEFLISSSVRTNVTLESLQLIKQIMSDYPNTFSEQDLKTTQSFLVRSNARAFETANAKLSMLRNISQYGYSPDYAQQRQAIVEQMSVEKIADLANRYANPDKMLWLVVGDAKTQMPRLEALGFGQTHLINADPE